MLDWWSWSWKCSRPLLIITCECSADFHILRRLKINSFGFMFFFLLSFWRSLPPSFRWKSRAVKLLRKHQSCLHFSGHPHLPTTALNTWAPPEGFRPAVLPLLSFPTPSLVHKSPRPHGWWSEAAVSSLVQRIGLIHVLVQQRWCIYVF